MISRMFVVTMLCALLASCLGSGSVAYAQADPPLAPTWTNDELAFKISWTASLKGSSDLASCTLFADVIGDANVGQNVIVPSTPEGGEPMAQAIHFPMNEDTARNVVRLEARVRCTSVRGTSSEWVHYERAIKATIPNTAPGMPGNLDVQPLPVSVGTTIIIVPEDGAAITMLKAIGEPPSSP